jgi:hypothetical protein
MPVGAERSFSFRVFDDDGQLVHRRGVTASPGVYFLGLS